MIEHDLTSAGCYNINGWFVNEVCRLTSIELIKEE